MLWIT